MQSHTGAKVIDILQVDDNPGDIDLTREALAESQLLNALYAVEDGEEALNFLHKRGKFSDAPRPDLILLDLNLPKKDGREVLAEIKDDDDLKRIPVIILTTSRAEDDVLNSYNLHANCYLAKPIDLDQFLHIVKSIEQFWMSVVTLPDGKEGTR